MNNSLLPDSWKYQKLEEIGTTLIGLTYSPSNVSEFGTLVLRSSNIQNNQLAFYNNVFVDMELPDRVIVKEKDLLICVRNGSRTLIGKCTLIDKKTEGSAFGAFMSIFRSPINEYVFHVFQSEVIQKQIRNNLGATINQITNNDLANFYIPVPPLAEQQKIAQALTDADNYISALEKLIEKKTMMKEGLMVNLLTGKQRLKEFAFNADGTTKGYKDSELGKIPEDWTVSCLGEHVTYIGSGSTNTQNSGEFPLYGSTGIIGSCEEAEYQGDSILVARVGANAGKVNSVTGLYGVSDNTIIIKLNDATDLDFLKYLLIKKNLNNIVFGSGQPLITGSQLRELLLVMPTKTEQTTIANVLKNIDLEIITLTSKVKKIYQVKQGMMQKLLTGEIRLA